ncbi:hypothetical protein ACH46F_02930 [Streptomyces virginiae]|uniref:hypothetical protein n=1 Tax=Streptomyces virginiae TaxID=1961 RepID=UPI003792671B
MNAILTGIKGKNPDLVFFGGMDATAGPMLRQMDQPGLLHGRRRHPHHRAGATGRRDGRAYAADPGFALPQDASFLKTYQDRFAAPPVQYAPYAYDALNAVIAAMAQADFPDPKIYRPHLADLTHHGITGPISFTATGDRTDSNITIHTLTNGQFTPA